MAGMAFSKEELTTYRAAQAIGDLIHSQARPGWPSGGFWMQDQRSYGVRYGMAQTVQGLYLIVGEGRMPTAAITPWGEYCIAGSFGGTATTTQAAITAIMAGMALQLDEPARKAVGYKTHWLYAIHRVGGITLPKPQLRPQEQCTPRDKAMRQWAELGKIVKSPH